MASTKIDRVESILSITIQALIMIAGVLAILVFGGTFIKFDIWNEYSLLTLAFGVLAVVFPILGFFKNAQRRNKELDVERHNKALEARRRDKELEWERFRARELMIVRTVELKSIIERWRNAGGTKDTQFNLYDPETQDLNLTVLGLLAELRDQVDYSIDLEDLDTAKEFTSNIRSELQNTPWLREWIKISISRSAKGRG